MYVCIRALVIGHETRISFMPYFFVICGLSISKTFSTFSHKRHDFWRKKLLRINCLLLFCIQILS